MIQIKLLFCAESASIDMRLNTVSAFHIAEEINALVFPVAVQKITVIMFLTREQTDEDSPALRLTITMGERSLFDGPLAVNFSQRLSTRAVADFNGLVIPAPGSLRFSVRLGDRELGAWNITINQISQAAMQQIIVPPTPSSAAH